MKTTILGLVLAAGLYGPVVAQEPVEFADPELRAAVERWLGVSDPTPGDMLALTSLVAERQGIVNLAGLEYATRLRSLHLSRNQISDVSPIILLEDWDDRAVRETI